MDQEVNFSEFLEFAKMTRLAMRDTQQLLEQNVAFGRYKKEDIIKFVRNPSAYERQLRDASRALYEASGHYRRLVNYFADMISFAYIVVPSNPRQRITDKDAYQAAYIKTITLIDTMHLKQEGNKLLRTMYRDGIVFGYEHSSSDSFYIRILDSRYCRISSIEDGCICFAFDFSFFDSIANHKFLSSYGPEFELKYEIYRNAINRSAERWQELSAQSICIKASEDNLAYSVPPFIGVMEELFDIEDYKQLTKAKEEAGNYNLLNLKIPMKDRAFLVDLDIAKKFYRDISAVLPNSVGVIMSPFETEKYSFAKSSVADANAVNDAEDQFWSASGVSELLFGGRKSSSNALSLSIIADEISAFVPVRQIERWVNRKLKSKGGNPSFKVKILDVTAFNRDKLLDALIKSGSSGLPNKNMIAAVSGYSPLDVLTMASLENDVLDMRNTVFGQPLLSSNTIAGSVGDDGGRPALPDDQLTESGEKTRDNDSNTNRSEA